MIKSASMSLSSKLARALTALRVMYSSVRSDIRGLVSSNGEAEVVWDEASARNGTCKVDPCKALARPRMTAVQINFMQSGGELDT